MPEANDILSALEGALKGLHPPLQGDTCVTHAQQLADLYTDVLGKPSDPAIQARLELAMAASVKVEPVWSLLAGLALWDGGRRLSHDFANVWNCARYAGIQSRFSAFTA